MALMKHTLTVDSRCMSAHRGIVLQKSFAAWESIFPSRRRHDRIIMWETTSPCAKLTGDSHNGFETALIGDCRLFLPLVENQPQCLWGLLQHYRHETDMSGRPDDVCS